MVRKGSALTKGAILVRTLVVCAQNMVVKGSALGNGATRPLILEKGVTRTCTLRKCARWKVAILRLLKIVFAQDMVLMERASLMAAPPTQQLDIKIATSTAVERSALCQDARPPLNARVAVPSMAVVLLNAGFEDAPSTAAEGRQHLALCQVAPPPLNARVSVAAYQ